MELLLGVLLYFAGAALVLSQLDEVMKRAFLLYGGRVRVWLAARRDKPPSRGDLARLARAKLAGGSAEDRVVAVSELRRLKSVNLFELVRRDDPDELLKLFAKRLHDVGNRSDMETCLQKVRDYDADSYHLTRASFLAALVGTVTIAVVAYIVERS
jgi:hypothetical protein